MNYKNFDYFKLKTSDVEVVPLTDITAANFHRVLVLFVSWQVATAMPAQCALSRVKGAAAREMQMYFTEHPAHIAYAEVWPNTVYLSSSPFKVCAGLTQHQLDSLSFEQAAGYDLQGRGDYKEPWFPQNDSHENYVLLFKPTGAEADVDETPTTDSTAQGSESGAGADSSELSELGIAKLCAEFSELKASLTHFRNDCALICEYVRTVDELANKLAAVHAVPPVARARKPRAGKADTKTPAPSTGNSVLDAL